MTAKAKSKRRNNPLHQIHWIDRGWQPAHIGLCLSEKAWKRQMKNMLVGCSYPKSDASTTMFSRKDSESVIIVTIDMAQKLDPLVLAGLIVHEATHVFDYVCEAMGEDKPSIEFKAYSTQAIFQSLSEKLEGVMK